MAGFQFTFFAIFAGGYKTEFTEAKSYKKAFLRGLGGFASALRK